MLKFWTTATASNVWTTHYLKGTTKEVSFDVSQLGEKILMTLKFIPATNSKRQVRKEMKRYERCSNRKAVGKRQKYILTGFESRGLYLPSHKSILQGVFAWKRTKLRFSLKNVSMWARVAISVKDAILFFFTNNLFFIRIVVANVHTLCVLFFV